ncbi:MAG: host attachment protein [Woeseiaceae bacterium]|nr:host attachment protein [Woeseiaceae bacterium]
MPTAENFLLPNEPTWICACSASIARCWRSTARYGQWTLVAEIRDEVASRAERELVSDRPGRAFDRAGHGRHAMEPRTSARTQEKRRFAHRVAQAIDRAVGTGAASRIVLLAGPKFLGLLRDELGPEARAAVVFEAAKNLTALDAAAIRHYFTPRKD